MIHGAPAMPAADPGQATTRVSTGAAGIAGLTDFAGICRAGHLARMCGRPLCRNLLAGPH